VVDLKRRTEERMIVDVHHHYALETVYPAYKDFPAELVDAMDRNGVDWTCLNGLGPDYHNRRNADVRRAMERFPDRILGVGYLDVDRMKPRQVDEFKRWGMRGLKVIGTLRRYDDDRYLPFYERAEACGMPILFHTGFLGGVRPKGRADESSDRYRPIMLDRIARLFTSLPLIAAHMGTMTWYQETLAVMCHDNVYADSSGGVSHVDPAFFRLPLNDRINWNKVVFGSDSLPNDVHIPLGGQRRLMKALRLDAATQRNVLGETAARVFGLSRRG
jgi:uncharacterized protein